MFQRTRRSAATPGDRMPHSAAARAFADWLLWLPSSADLCAAARAQIASIDRRALQHPDVQFLRTLLVAVASSCASHQPLTQLQ